MRFSLNRFTRVLRAAATDDGSDLGITSEASDPQFAGAGTDKEWDLESSELGMFEDGQDLSNLSDGAVNQGDVDESDLDEDASEEEGEDLGSLGEDLDEELDEETDEESDEETDEESDEESDEELDEESDEESDEVSDEESDEVDTEAAARAVTEFSDMASTSDALTKALTDAQKNKFSVESFKKNNADLYKAMNEANREYQQAVADEEVDDMVAAQEKLFEAQTAISTKQAAESANSGSGEATAKAAVLKELDVAIEKSAAIYKELDAKGEEKNPILIRLVNSTFHNKLAAGTSHVKAFVEAVEEIAYSHKLTAAGTISAEVKDKTADTRTKKSVKKRLDASKKNPKRSKATPKKGKKLNASSMKGKTGNDFFADAFVKDLGITTDER